MEFSRPVTIEPLPDEAVFDIAASEPERAPLAHRFGLLALDRLEARIRLERLPGGLLRLAADLAADVVQECVVTLEPVASRLEDSFTLLYGEPQNGAGEVVLSGEAELVEPIPGSTIDIGEAVAQQLSLVLDPYPRAPGVVAPTPAPGETKPDSPFAALAKWKRKS